MQAISLRISSELVSIWSGRTKQLQLATQGMDIMIQRLRCQAKSRAGCGFRQHSTDLTVCDCSRASLLPNPRIRNRIQNIGEEINQHISEPNRQNASLHEKVVA